MSRSRKPLLVFDSGVGGLSVLAEIRALLPTAPIVYCADNAGFPYGAKSEAELAARVPALLGRLVERYDPLLVVIACNTASTIALGHVRAALDLPVVGTVPAIKPAALASKTRVIGVLGTPATVRQAYVDNLVAEFAADCTVLRHGSVELVVLAEQKLRGQPTAPEAYRAVLDGLFGQPGGDRLDTVVLACTHFPLVREELTAVAPHPVQWIDSGAGIARRAAHLSAGHVWQDAPQGLAVFTRHDDSLVALRPALLHYGLAQMEIL
ncbi:glutamate racemase [Parapedomonas caeni]